MFSTNAKLDYVAQGKKNNAKIYRNLMPLLILAYIISFIDRTNIGMAKNAMSIDLGLSATAFGIGAGLFFLTYSILEIPSNLIMEKVGARFWITRIMITWGLLSAAMAFVTGPTSFYILRLLLGAAEAGLYPGVILYMTYWFSQEERAKATGLFLLGVCLANIIGAPLSGLLLSMDGLLGFHGWQWMFVIEGLPAVILAFVVWFVLPNKPEDAKWLDEDDRNYIKYKHDQDKNSISVSNSKFSLKAAFKNKAFMMIVAIYFTHQFSVYGLSYFLPTIIGEYGKLTPIQIGLLTAIPWISAAIGGIFVARKANTPRRSSRILISGYAVMAVGLVIGALGGPVVGLIGFCLTAFMFFVVQSIIFSLPPTYMSGSMLAGSLALLNCLGLFGGFLGPFILGFFEDYTGTATSGLWFGVGLLVIGTIIASRVNTNGMSEAEPLQVSTSVESK
ncbi:MFS transporter [Providencia rettgeri]|uniref:MFS transporter n=1 Tax=Providencia rettgeri TaxID=587 RepID=A0A264VPP4_PRORE|nr:MFS transporter [Providencia rettgeri]OZS73336.1 MFS transporter [Providencia rettgeri]